MFVHPLRERPGADATTIVVSTALHGYWLLGQTEPLPYAPAEQLRVLLDLREFEDMLVTAQGADLAMLDDHVRNLPLCRTMERTRNSALQQRQQFRAWLDRGLISGEAQASGHIRWGRAIAGLTGKLGEFTVRYAGAASPKGHLIVMEANTGTLALGYATAAGEPLEPERVISNKGRLRAEMAAMLRAFAAAIPSWPADHSQTSHRKG